MLADVQTLHMVRLRFDLPALLRRVGANAASAAVFDLGYLVHWQLVSLFGDSAPATFAIRGEPSAKGLSASEGRWLEVLAYAAHNAEALRAVSRTAERAAVEACDWSSFDAKPMPGTWRSGTRLGFEVRICPIVRRSKDGPQSKDGPRWRRGAEVDAFLAACDAAAGSPVDRMTVYRDWLTRQFARDDAAQLAEFDPAGFRRVRLHRRTQGDARRGQSLERPELTVTGTIVVNQPEAFNRLLSRGIGRHRAFGFGMLLIRPGR